MLNLTLILNAKTDEDFNWGVGHLGEALLRMALFSPLKTTGEPYQLGHDRITPVTNPDTGGEVTFQIIISGDTDVTDTPDQALSNARGN